MLLSGDISNCSEWRDLAISDAFNRAADQNLPYAAHCKLAHFTGWSNYLDPAIQDLTYHADLIRIQRNIINDQVLDAIRYWRGLGKVIAVDIDDSYLTLPPSNPAYPFWIGDSSGTEPLRKLEEGIRLCGALVSPNRLILQDWQAMIPGLRTYHLQNYARSEWWLPEVNITQMRHERGIADDRIIIGWGGSVSHYDSFWGSGIREAAARVSTRHPEVLWMLCGNDPRLYDQFTVPIGQKFMQPGVLPSDWPKIVKMFDIGTAPLYGLYDQHRSWIKGMEYMLAGIPWIGTEGETYGALANWNDMLVPNMIDAWESALEVAINNLSALKSLAQSRVEMSRNLFLVDRNLSVIDDVFTRIINDSSDAGSNLPGIMHLHGESQ